jgi:hypothetical protein
MVIRVRAKAVGAARRENWKYQICCHKERLGRLTEERVVSVTSSTGI